MKTRSKEEGEPRNSSKTLLQTHEELKKQQAALILQHSSRAKIFFQGNFQTNKEVLLTITRKLSEKFNLNMSRADYRTKDCIFAFLETNWDIFEPLLQSLRITSELDSEDQKHIRYVIELAGEIIRTDKAGKVPRKRRFRKHKLLDEIEDLKNSTREYGEQSVQTNQELQFNPDFFSFSAEDEVSFFEIGSTMEGELI